MCYNNTSIHMKNRRNDMKFDQLRSRCRPHLWYQLYWVVYLIWFF